LKNKIRTEILNWN